jgi:hypothetical protein
MSQRSLGDRGIPWGDEPKPHPDPFFSFSLPFHPLLDPRPSFTNLAIFSLQGEGRLLEGDFSQLCRHLGWGMRVDLQGASFRWPLMEAKLFSQQMRWRGRRRPHKPRLEKFRPCVVSPRLISSVMGASSPQKVLLPPQVWCGCWTPPPLRSPAPLPTLEPAADDGESPPKIQFPPFNPVHILF